MKFKKKNKKLDWAITHSSASGCMEPYERQKQKQK